MIINNHPIKVYYRDIDQMGIVYYSRYLEYFEEGRTELLNQIGLDVSSIEKKGIMLPVTTSHCDYKVGLKLEQKIIIESSIKKYPKATLCIDYKVLDSKNKEIMAVGYTKHAFLNNLGSPMRVPKFILNTLKINGLT